MKLLDQYWLIEDFVILAQFFQRSMDSLEDIFYEVIVDHEKLIGESLVDLNSISNDIIKLMIDDVLIKIDTFEKRIIGSTPKAQEFNEWSVANSDASWRKLFTHLLQVYLSNKEENSWDQEEEKQEENPEEDNYDEWDNYQEDDQQKEDLDKVGLNMVGGAHVNMIASILDSFKQSELYKDALLATDLESECMVQDLRNFVKVLVIPESLEIRYILNIAAFNLSFAAKSIIGLKDLNPIVIVFQINPAQVFGGQQYYKQLSVEKMLRMKEFTLNFTQFLTGDLIKDSFFKSLVLKFVELVLNNYSYKPISKYAGKRLADRLMRQNYYSSIAISQKSKGFKLASEKDSVSGTDSVQPSDKELLAVLEENVKSLTEMGFDYNQSYHCIYNLQLTVQQSVDLLQDESFFIGSKSKKPPKKGKTGILQRLGFKKASPSPDKEMLEEEKFEGKQRATDSFFYAMGLFLYWRFKKFNAYCAVCHDPMHQGSFKPLPCEQELCQFRFEEVLGDCLARQIKYHYNRFTLELSLAWCSIFSHRNLQVFEPFPPYFLKDREIRSKAGFFDVVQDGKAQGEGAQDTNKDFHILIKLARSLPTFKAMLAHSESEEDLKQMLIEYYSKVDSKKLIGENTHIAAYKLMQFVMQNNPLTLIQLEGKQSLFPDNPIKQYIIISPPSAKERSFQKEKQKKGSLFVWHGSSVENWYSIIRNGLRVLSNTKLMTAGAAYGVGVYSATQMATSLGYSRQHNGEQLPTETLIPALAQVIGIIEIINVKEYAKGNGFYVISKDNHVRLRYLLISQGQGNCDLSVCQKHYYLFLKEEKKRMEMKFKKESEKYEPEFERCLQRERVRQDGLKEQIDKNRQQKIWEQDEQLQEFQKKIVGKGSNRASQRIMSEYKLLIGSKDFKDFKIEIASKSSVYVWNLVLDILKFDISKDLANDFKAYAQKVKRKAELVFELTFPQNYPYSPPFIRVIRPRFQYLTGHITIGGSICTQALTPSGWNISRTIESLFIEIIVIITDGAGRLDRNNFGNDYTMGEAKEAFNRVAARYGWL